jgi:hypothetical protein
MKLILPELAIAGTATLICTLRAEVGDHPIQFIGKQSRFFSRIFPVRLVTVTFYASVP